MPKSPSLEQKDFARSALIEATSKSKVGNFIEVFEDGESVATYLFENNQKGYVGWRWSVTVFQADSKDPATISEIVLLPGPDSLVAPDWVPWSERLADYKALQLELEKQAALEAEDSDDDEDTDDEDTGDEVDNFEEISDEADDSDNSADEAGEANSESAVADLKEGEDAEDDAEDTGRKPPRFLRRRKGFKIKKARGKGKNPQD